MACESNEPWHIELGFDAHELVDKEGMLILSSHQKSWKYAERILACVNACRGIPTETLTSGCPVMVDISRPPSDPPQPPLFVQMFSSEAEAEQHCSDFLRERGYTVTDNHEPGGE